MKRATILAIGLVLVAVLVWIWQSGRTKLETAARATTAADVAASDSASPLSAVVQNEKERSALRTDEIASDPPKQATNRERRDLTVVVIDATSHAPIPNAEVFVADEDESESTRHELWQHVHELIASIEAKESVRRSNEQGRVQIPMTSVRRILYGRSDARRGMVKIDEWSRSPVIVPLHVDFDVAVRVVDRSGVPVVGVPVALAFGSNSRYLSEGETALTSGSSALVTLRHVGLALGLNEVEQGFVALAGLFDPPVCAAVDALRPPVEPLTLITRETGTLEVVAKHLDDSPDIDSTWVSIQSIRSNPAPLEGTESESWIADLREGRVVVPGVELGRRFKARVFRNGSGMPACTEADGPKMAGERVVLMVNVDQEDHAQAILARFLDEAGRPIASARVQFSLCAPERDSSSVSYVTKTDHAARIRFAVPDDASERMPTYVVFSKEGPRPLGGLTSFARVPLTTGLSPGITDLGDVVLTAGALLVRGRVFDEQHLPVPGAQVSIAHEGRWAGVWPGRIRALSDTAGEFELRGMCTAERFFVSAAIDGARSARQEFQLGDVDIELIVQRTGQIDGLIRLPLGVETGDFGIYVERETKDGLGGAYAEFDFDGTIHFSDLVAGTYRIRVHLKQEDVDLLDVRGVVVVGGGIVRPPEIDPLDLVDEIHLHELSARDREGQALTELAVRWWPSGQPLTANGPSIYVPNGRVRMVSVEPQIDVAVVADRKRVAWVPGMSGKREITMVPDVRLKIVLSADAPLPPAPFTLTPNLIATAQSHDQSVWSAEPFSAARETYTSARENGQREVYFTVRKGDDWAPDGDIHPATPQFVTIADEPDEQTVTVTVSEAELRRAMAAYPQ